MKKIITFLIAIFSMFNIYAQEVCVEFDTAWIAAFGVYSGVHISKIDNEGNIYILTNYNQGNTIIGNITLPPPPQSKTGTLLAKFDSSGNFLWVIYSVSQVNGSVAFTDLILDDNGNAYLIGAFKGTISLLGNTLISTVSGNSIYQEGDGLLAKINKTGQLQWVKTHPGVWHLRITKSDNSDFLYVASSINEITTAIMGIDTFNSYGKTDMLISKIDMQGEIEYSIHIGGVGNDDIHDISIDSTDNLYIVGTYTDLINFGSFSLIPSFTNNKRDLFVTKMDSQGNFSWINQTTRLDNMSEIGWACLDINKQNDIYIFGNFLGNVDFGGNGLHNNTNSINNGSYICVLNAQGQFLNAQQIVNNSSFVIFDGLVENMDEIVIVGYFEGTLTYGNTTLTANNKDAFIAKVQPHIEGINYKWTLHSGGMADESGTKIASITPGNYYISGSYNTGDAIFGVHTLNTPSSTGYTHGFIAKISECEPSDINDPNPLAQISTFPNPAHTQLTVANLPVNSTVSISDITGKVLYTQKNKHSTLQIPTTQWSSGMYFVKIKSGESVVNKKIVINLEK